jgi:hypothetical protein
MVAGTRSQAPEEAVDPARVPWITPGAAVGAAAGAGSRSPATSGAVDHPPNGSSTAGSPGATAKSRGPAGMEAPSTVPAASKATTGAGAIPPITKRTGTGTASRHRTDSGTATGEETRPPTGDKHRAANTAGTTMVAGSPLLTIKGPEVKTMKSLFTDGAMTLQDDGIRQGSTAIAARRAVTGNVPRLRQATVAAHPCTANATTPRTPGSTRAPRGIATERQGTIMGHRRNTAIHGIAVPVAARRPHATGIKTATRQIGKIGPQAPIRATSATAHQPLRETAAIATNLVRQPHSFRGA